MTFRLYRTTRPLYTQIVAILSRLGPARMGGSVTLIALYVGGLVLLDVRQAQTCFTLRLPARSHDARNRLLRVVPFSTKALAEILIAFVKLHTRSGYLCLDDCVVEKAFARRLPWAGWTYFFAKKRKVCGLHIVLLAWCNSDGL